MTSLERLKKHIHEHGTEDAAGWLLRTADAYGSPNTLVASRASRVNIHRHLSMWPVTMDENEASAWCELLEVQP